MSITKVKRVHVAAKARRRSRKRPIGLDKAYLLELAQMVQCEQTMSNEQLSIAGPLADLDAEDEPFDVVKPMTPMPSRRVLARRGSQTGVKGPTASLEAC